LAPKLHWLRRQSAPQPDRRRYDPRVQGDDDQETPPGEPASEPAARPTPRRPRRATVVTTLIAIAAVYFGSLVGSRVLEEHASEFAFTEPVAQTETVVILRLRQLNAVENRLTVDVLVHPGRELLSREGQSQSVRDLTVRLTSWTRAGELIFMHPDVSSGDDTSLIAVGDPDNWPFDAYSTDIVGVEVVSGANAAPQVVPARVVVAGQINGWDVHTDLSTIDSPPAPEQTVHFTLERTRAALAFDLGIIAVLLTLPATALFVAIETLLGRRKFLPPLTTWFAAMLFAVVPVRNLLPGAPPAAAWIDRAVVLWVLVALAVAMVMYIAAWWRQSE
jgi:hypothetical protein